MADTWESSTAADDAIVDVQMSADGLGGGGGQEKWLIGATVKLTTGPGETIQGEVYTFDEGTGAVMLRMPNTSRITDPSVFDYRMVQQKFIKTIQYVAPPKGDAMPMPAPSYVNVKELHRQERKAIQEADLALSRIGVDVGERAQKIFDAITKTFDAVWDGKKIVLRDMEVVINPPYNEDSVEGGNAKAKKQIIVVLNGELKKLGPP